MSQEKIIEPPALSELIITMCEHMCSINALNLGSVQLPYILTMINRLERAIHKDCNS